MGRPRGSSRRPPQPLGYHWDSRDPAVRPDGARPCKLCKEPVGAGRRNWCGRPLRWCLRCDLNRPAGDLPCPRCGMAEPAAAVFCEDVWRAWRSPGELRGFVLARDRGVCAGCGVDTAPFDTGRILREQYLSKVWHDRPDLRRSMRPRPEFRPDGTPWPPEWWRARYDEAMAWRAANRVPVAESPWQMDHIIPVSRGGSWTALANLRTLCVPCHRVVTAGQARERARARKGTA
jgi:hypothetical protein